MPSSIELLPAAVCGLSPLARAALAGDFAPAGLPLPRAAAALEPPSNLARRFDRDERERLALALERNLTGLEPHVAVIEAVRSLARPEATLVVTACAPGLYASPLDGLWRALCALRLAALLARRWGAPVTALLWNRADRPGLSDLNPMRVLNPNLDVQRVGLAGLSGERTVPGRLVLEDGRHHLPAVRALLAQMHGDHPHVERALELLAPRAGETVARAFTRTMLELFGARGLIVAEPDWLRAQLSRALTTLVGRDPLALLRRGAAALSARGFEPGEDPGTAALVLRLDGDAARALRAGGEGFRYDGEPGSRTAAELAAEIAQEPAAWAAGELLEPLALDRALPVAARCGALAELALHAVLAPARDAGLAPATPFVPRPAITLIDPAAQRSLAALGLGPAEVLGRAGAPPAAPIGGGAEPLAPSEPEEPAEQPQLVRDLRERARRTADELLAHRAELAAIERGLAGRLARVARDLCSGVERLCERAERALANRSGTRGRHVRRLENALRPLGRGQEEVFGPLPFLARCGTGWLDALGDELDPFAAEHLTVRLCAGEEGQN